MKVTAIKGITVDVSSCLEVEFFDVTVITETGQELTFAEPECIEYAVQHAVQYGPSASPERLRNLSPCALNRDINKLKLSVTACIRESLEAQLWANALMADNELVIKEQA